MVQIKKNSSIKAARTIAANRKQPFFMLCCLLIKLKYGASSLIFNNILTKSAAR